MNRADLYWVNLEPATPPEFGKLRPALIVSNSEQNTILSTVVVLPISSQPPEIWPLRLALPKRIGNIRTSFAVIPGIRQVSKARLYERIGQAPLAFLKELDAALQAYLQD